MEVLDVVKEHGGIPVGIGLLVMTAVKLIWYSY